MISAQIESLKRLFLMIIFTQQTVDFTISFDMCIVIRCRLRLNGQLYIAVSGHRESPSVNDHSAPVRYRLRYISAAQSESGQFSG